MFVLPIMTMLNVNTINTVPSLATLIVTPNTVIDSNDAFPQKNQQHKATYGY